MHKGLMIMTLLALSIITSYSFAYTEKQADAGKQIFVKQCAECHGSGGEGGTVPVKFGKNAGKKVPAVVGKDALPDLKTAADAYAFIKNNMPMQKPGSLSKEEAINVLAFDLMANGIKADGQPLTEENAKMISLH